MELSGSALKVEGIDSGVLAIKEEVRIRMAMIAEVLTFDRKSGTPPV